MTNINTYQGRINRRTWIVGILVSTIMMIIFSGLSTLIKGAGSFIFFAIIYILFAAFILWIYLRRLKDTDKSAWYLLLMLIPGIGALILIIMMCLKGTEGVNNFGAPQPKDAKILDVLFKPKSIIIPTTETVPNTQNQ